MFKLQCRCPHEYLVFNKHLDLITAALKSVTSELSQVFVLWSKVLLNYSNKEKKMFEPLVCSSVMTSCSLWAVAVTCELSLWNQTRIRKRSSLPGWPANLGCGGRGPLFVSYRFWMGVVLVRQVGLSLGCPQNKWWSLGWNSSGRRPDEGQWSLLLGREKAKL